MTLESLQRDDALALAEVVSASASETMSGRPDSRTVRTMLSEMPPVRVGDRLAAHVARGADVSRDLLRSCRRGCRRLGLVEEKNEALVGAGELDDVVEHRLEQLVDASPV